MEQGRWTKRGAEPSQQFNASTRMVSMKELKLAVKDDKDQSKVWNQVSATQAKLSKNAPIAAGVSAGRVAQAVTVQSEVSPSSMQLTLENEAVKKAVEGYTTALARLPEKDPDVVGFAFAINGEVNSADVYANPQLFRSLWPKLLQAAATEAVAKPAPAEGKPYGGR